MRTIEGIMAEFMPDKDTELVRVEGGYALLALLLFFGIILSMFFAGVAGVEITRDFIGRMDDGPQVVHELLEIEGLLLLMSAGSYAWIWSFREMRKDREQPAYAD